jgi:acetyltransferase
MAIVAEVTHGGERRLVGVGRLVADAEHRNAEYAVLVADDWQGRGLGSQLTAYCLEICRTWGIDCVYAETTTDNERMQRILQRQRFHQKRTVHGDMLYELRLGGYPINERPESHRSRLAKHAPQPV